MSTAMLRRPVTKINSARLLVAGTGIALVAEAAVFSSGLPARVLDLLAGLTLLVAMPLLLRWHSGPTWFGVMIVLVLAVSDSWSGLGCAVLVITMALFLIAVEAVQAFAWTAGWRSFIRDRARPFAAAMVLAAVLVAVTSLPLDQYGLAMVLVALMGPTVVLLAWLLTIRSRNK